MIKKIFASFVLKQGNQMNYGTDADPVTIGLTLNVPDAIHLHNMCAIFVVSIKMTDFFESLHGFYNN